MYISIYIQRQQHPAAATATATATATAKATAPSSSISSNSNRNSPKRTSNQSGRHRSDRHRSGFQIFPKRRLIRLIQLSWDASTGWPLGTSVCDTLIISCSWLSETTFALGSAWHVALFQHNSFQQWLNVYGNFKSQYLVSSVAAENSRRWPSGTTTS